MLDFDRHFINEYTNIAADKSNTQVPSARAEIPPVLCG